MIEFSCAFEICVLENLGIRYGPMRTASAISVAVTLQRRHARTRDIAAAGVP